MCSTHFLVHLSLVGEVLHWCVKYWILKWVQIRSSCLIKMVICIFVKWYGCEYPPIWRPVLSLFYPPVIIRGKNGKNSESPVGSNKNEKRKPKSAVYRSFWASVVYFHLRLISTKNHKGEMTRNQFASNRTRVRIPPAAPYRRKR